MDPFQKSIELALEKLREQEAEVAETKRAINSLRKWSGQPPLFPDAEAPAANPATGFRSDQFYGQPLSSVVRQILEARKAAGLGAASVSEIYETMIAGGYKFDTANEENSKRVLRISLTKNSATFHKLPSGEYGLRAWYPGIKESRPKTVVNTTDAKEAMEEVETEGFDFEAKEKEADQAKASA